MKHSTINASSGIYASDTSNIIITNSEIDAPSVIYLNDTNSSCTFSMSKLGGSFIPDNACNLVYAYDGNCTPIPNR